jgi:type II secretory ATPase GspE/PulE/Tfp pilus assembly ATPase PilB-like protein
MIQSVLRSDVNNLFIGEIRTPTIARKCIENAISAMLVASTLHANSALGAYSRLIGLGFEPAELAQPNLINLVVCNKLIPTLCSCKIDFDDLEEAKKEQVLCIKEFKLEDLKKYSFARPGGCKKCDGLGFLGRKLIQEYIRPTSKDLDFIKRSDFDGWMVDLKSRNWKSIKDQVIPLLETKIFDLNNLVENLHDLAIDEMTYEY